MSVLGPDRQCCGQPHGFLQCFQVRSEHYDLNIEESIIIIIIDDDDDDDDVGIVITLSIMITM